MESRISSKPPGPLQEQPGPFERKRKSWPPKEPIAPDRLAHNSFVLIETLARVGQNLAAGRGSVTVLGKEFHASEKVFSPKFSLEDTEIFAQNIPVRPGERMLEIGTGTGILSIHACYRGASEIVAVDINWKAVFNAQANVDLHGMNRRISVRKGNVYSAVRKGEKFDTIFWNVPFVFAKKEDVFAALERLQKDAGGDPAMREALERLPHDLRHFDAVSGKDQYFLWAAYIDNDYVAIRQFIRGARKRLNPGGKLLVCFSSTYGEMDLLEQLADEAKMDVRIIFERANSRGVMLEIIEMSPRVAQPEQQQTDADAEASEAAPAAPQGPAPPAAE